MTMDELGARLRLDHQLVAVERELYREEPPGSPLRCPKRGTTRT